jgi:hypothetical protein
MSEKKSKSKLRKFSGHQTKVSLGSSGSFVASVLKVMVCFEITTEYINNVWGTFM